MRRAPKKDVTLALAIFFGGIGLHKFYLGKIGQGIIYIILFPVFGFSILLAFVDVVHLIRIKEKDFKKENGIKSLKSCKYCGEEILENATKCRYCKSNQID